MSQNPLGFDAGDANFYRYLANDPANSTDPSGLEDEKALEAQFEMASGVANAIDKTLTKVPLTEKQLTLPGKTTQGDSITFTFEKAYVGSWMYKLGRVKPEEVAGAYIKLRIDVNTKAFDEIRVIQVVRNVKMVQKSGTKDQYEYVAQRPDAGFRRGIADWDNPQARSPGWGVDKPTPTDDKIWAQGWVNSASNSVVIWDAPASNAEQKDQGRQSMPLRFSRLRWLA
jgi:hypothetical protein